MFGQGEDGKALGDVFFEPLGKLCGVVSVGVDEMAKIFRCACQGRGIPDLPEFRSDAFSDRDIRRVMNGILREVELAALPRGARQHGLPGGAQAGMTMSACARGVDPLGYGG